MLSDSELERYDRQIQIEEIGKEGQEKLKSATVFIAGAGGLGSPIALYLAAAGIGTLRIADHDRVDPSNLNRQILHWEEDLGKKKVDSAAVKLSSLNSGSTIEAVAETLSEENILELVDGCDLFIDALDNLPARILLNRTAVIKKVPYIHGAVNGFEGRVMTVIPGQTACFGCMIRGPVPEKRFPVIGVTPAVIGSVQATEAIKYITGSGKLLTNRMLVYDGLKLSFTEYRIRKNPDCDYCGKE